MLLVALCVVLFFVGLGERPLWDVDEGMHAATSKVMVESGDWLTPMHNGERFYDKPVLYPWLVALSFVVFGFTEFAARFPAALFGTATVLATYWLGCGLFNRLVALLGAATLATSLKFLVMSRVVVHDVVFTFWVTLGLAAWWAAYRAQEDAIWSRRRWLALCYFAGGVALLTKGPLGVVLIALVALPFLLVERRLAFLKRMGLPWGALIVLVVAAPWYVAMVVRHPDYGAYFFIQQNLLNFTSEGARHAAPFHYYIGPFLGGLFPWSGFIPVAVWTAWQARQTEHGSAYRFLLAWLASVLLFFSVASSKIPSYIMPLFPAAALLVGAAWGRLFEDPAPARRRWFLLSQLLPFAVLSLALAYFWMVRLDEFIDWYDLELHRFVIPIAIMFGGLLVSAVLLMVRRDRASYGALTAMVVVFILVLQVTIIPGLNPYRTSRQLAGRLDGLLPAGEQMVHYMRLFDSALFYNGRTAVVEENATPLVGRFSGDGPTFCIIRWQDYRKIDALQNLTEVIATEGNKLLITNR